MNAVKTEQKPVECNLCHRKFKNIPALNGHMRLHGGYFKKDAEAKKCDKKETTGPPLQTASVGIRALIEEKIISKRGKDILKVRITLNPNCLWLFFVFYAFLLSSLCHFGFYANFSEFNSILLLLLRLLVFISFHFVCRLEFIRRTCTTNVITPIN